jgi:hypothetical protein
MAPLLELIAIASLVGVVGLVRAAGIRSGRDLKFGIFQRNDQHARAPIHAVGFPNAHDDVFWIPIVCHPDHAGNASQLLPERVVDGEDSLTAQPQLSSTRRYDRRASGGTAAAQQTSSSTCQAGFQQAFHL